MSRTQLPFTVTAFLAVILALSLLWKAGSAEASVSPQARTCAAYSTWLHHKSTANLDAMVSATFTGTGWTVRPGKYIVQDAASLYSDVRSASAKYIPGDEKYLTEDCAGI